MSRTDLIADALTIMRNAMMAKKEAVDIPSSGMLKAVLEILKREGYIENFKPLEDSKRIQARVYLKYVAGKPAIRSLIRVSRPGLRVYVKKKKVPVVLRGRGIAIVSTSKGIMTDNEAREASAGGEVIVKIW
jgi:small subunit ribosomal protein S8